MRRISSIDSSLAGRMKAQVLMRMTVGLLGPVGKEITAFGEGGGHDLGIDQILGAAEADDMDLFLGHG